MNFELSDFGRKLTGPSGISSLMVDLDAALNGPEPMLMLGGGNPGRIQAVEDVLRRALGRIAGDADAFHRAFGIYDSPGGSIAFVQALAELLSGELGTQLSPANIALTNGSQNSFFFLFNMLAGQTGNSRRQILLPMVPEYIGYADIGVSPNLFVARPAGISQTGAHRFKYHIDFDALPARGEVQLGAVCVSRPTNPTGNVLTAAEVNELSAYARTHEVPLIVDAAYGAPFPGLVYVDEPFRLEDNMILTLSLSKLGFPGARTGIVVGPEQIITGLGRLNAITNLSTGSLGPAVAEDLVRSRAIVELSEQVLRPHYEARARTAQATLDAAMQAGGSYPYAIHDCEGAFFMWVRFTDLPISTAELYERLKRRGVIVVPGEFYFPGLGQQHTDDPHLRECIRVSYSQSEADVVQGLEIIAEEACRAYAGAL